MYFQYVLHQKKVDKILGLQSLISFINIRNNEKHNT